MKVATYNIWNSNIETREEQLTAEINGIDADILGLQEVPLSFWPGFRQKLKYEHQLFFPYEGEDEGLALLSKHRIQSHSFLNEAEEHHNSQGLNILLEANNIRYSITNVHLPWDSALAKEQQIVAIDRFIHAQKEQADFFILLGDFNCTLSSSVHHFLLGDQSLRGYEAKPYWYDLAGSYAALNGYAPMPTLDFVKNPRWGGKNTIYIPDTCDRIYLMDKYNWDFEYSLKEVKLFGQTVSADTKLAPSDHYGVYAEIDFYLEQP